MIVKINGRPVDQWRSKPQSTVKSETFSWKTVTKTPENVTKTHESVKNNTKTETVRQRFNRYLPAIKKRMTPLVSGVNLLAAYPVSAMANTYSAPVAYSTNVSTVATGTNFGLGNALAPIISMLQELALPVGIGMAIWGLIEVMVGNPGGRDKIKWSLISYVGVFIIPFFFYQVKGAFNNIPLA